MEKLIIPVHLDNFTNRKDKSVAIKFVTALEQTPEGIANIYRYVDRYGSLVFKPEGNLTEAELDDLDKVNVDLMDGQKSQAKRIRGVLYLNYMQDDEGYKEFPEYYKAKTEQIISHFKSKLDD